MPSDMTAQASSTGAAPHVNVPSTETKALVGERNAWSRARLQLSYLIDPSKSGAAPGRFRTRALLRSLHHLGVFVFWRVVRWAKYAIVGSVVAALGSFAAAGSLASGVGILLAPPGILASIAIGTVWGLGKWAWRRHLRKSGHDVAGGPQMHPKVAEKEPELLPW